MATEMPELRVLPMQKTVTIPVKLNVECQFQPYDLKTRLTVQGSYQYNGRFHHAVRAVDIETDGFKPNEMQDLANLLARFVSRQLELDF
jgi:hypothetical protein